VKALNIVVGLAALTLLASTRAEAQPPPAPAPLVQLTSLELLWKKGVISDAEYKTALNQIVDSVGNRSPDEPTVVIAKWSTTLYGFVEADSIYDTTRSFTEAPGSGLVAEPGTTAGNNSRVQFAARNSRLGLQMRAPETYGVRVSGQIECDFQGTQLPVSTTSTISPSPYGTESTFYTSAVLRIRHLNLKVETPWVDILFGQYWTLFGWGPSYQANRVEFGGMPAEIYERTPQLRLSKTVASYPVRFDAAVGAFRPVQRDSGAPDLQGGLRLALDSWKGLQTQGATGSTVSPASFAISGLLRHVAVNDFNPVAGNTNTQDLYMVAFAADVFLPVIPAKSATANVALSIHGEFSTGYGDGDIFSTGSAGINFPTIPGTTYSPDVDPGIVTFDPHGGLHAIEWTSYFVGAELYLPPRSRWWVSGNYGHLESANSHYYTNGTCGTGSCGVLFAEDWFDANVFADLTPAVRVGVEYANFNDTYVNGLKAINHRGQLSGFFLF
jgi:hypothetical protein